MFRFTALARYAPLSVALCPLFCTTASAQAVPSEQQQAPVTNQVPASTPSSQFPGGVSRRVRANRQARIARDIQDTYSHRYEVAGGGGYLRFRTGQYLQKISQVNFFTTVGYALNPQFSVVGDVRGMYGNANIPNVYSKNNVFSPKISEYTFMAGPQYRFIGKEKYSISASATGGVALSKFGGDAKGLRSEDLGMWPDSNYKPVFAINLIGDYNIYTNLSARVQPTYLGTTFGNTLQNNLGIQFGVVYRLGRQK